MGKRFGATKTINIRDIDDKEFTMLLDVITEKKGGRCGN